MHRKLIAACTGIIGLLCTGADAGGLAVQGLSYEREWSAVSLDEVMPSDTNPFGKARSTWWSVGGAVATYLGDNTDYQAHGAIHHFLADDVEVIGELALWYMDQEGPNTYGVNPQFGVRWHFWGDQPRAQPQDPSQDQLQFQPHNTTLFGEIGIGALFTADEVPTGGTSLNFVPRVGVGFTHRLGDSRARLVAGVRWHHISNARIRGDDRNPSRDAPLVHFGVMFPF